MLLQFSYTPLHVAASKGHAAVIELLLDRGADLSAKGFVSGGLDVANSISLVVRLS